MQEEQKDETAHHAPILDLAFKPLNLGTQFIQKGQTVIVDDILVKYKILAICFGASWCIITKDFINHLLAYYQQINIEQKELEIIFVSMEKTEQDYKKFTKNMPWLCIPYSDVRINDLKDFYKIRSLPQVIVLHPNGDPINITNGRQDVYVGGQATFNKWISLKSEI